VRPLALPPRLYHQAFAFFSQNSFQSDNMIC
jgi:hypothetical protein